ncbi:hypothetical protein RDn1_145 [Candidatus Termititenax dinenymphae]|uniref:Uncharacterized protein n=1 Tax=Candidatus Termititenax dinenymphae TaxID=2218523 RepID=A0A388TKA1_9BACT|nr:hypothetical protein RDn1_145 [Candidatus Termititenax dinenymphae]
MWQKKLLAGNSNWVFDLKASMLVEEFLVPPAQLSEGAEFLIARNFYIQTSKQKLWAIDAASPYWIQNFSAVGIMDPGRILVLDKPVGNNPERAFLLTEPRKIYLGTMSLELGKGVLWQKGTTIEAPLKSLVLRRDNKKFNLCGQILIDDKSIGVFLLKPLQLRLQDEDIWCNFLRFDKDWELIGFCAPGVAAEVVVLGGQKIGLRVGLPENIRLAEPVSVISFGNVTAKETLVPLQNTLAAVEQFSLDMED